MLSDPFTLLTVLTVIGVGEAVALAVKAHNQEYWGQHTFGLFIGVWALIVLLNQ